MIAYMKLSFVTSRWFTVGRCNRVKRRRSAETFFSPTHRDHFTSFEFLVLFEMTSTFINAAGRKKVSGLMMSSWAQSGVGIA